TKVGLSSRDIATLKRLYSEGIACRPPSARHLLSMAVAPQLVAQLMQVDKEEFAAPVSGNNKRQIAAAAEYTLFASWVQPNLPLKGVMLCVHGLGLHKGTYSQFGERMSRQGWGVYAVDVRGFGSFQEMPGAGKVDLAGCLDDIKRSLIFLRGTHPRL